MVCILLATSAARANETETQVKVARAACLSGDYAKGAAILAMLFVETRDPTYVFNQGRCFEQNGRNREAIDRFREYLRIAPNLGEDAVALTKKHIADCQALLGQGEPVPPTSKASPSPPAQPSPAVPQPTAVLDDAKTAPAAQETAGSGLRLAGVTVAAIGGAALVTGVLLNLKVNRMASDLENPGAYSRTTESQRADYATATWVAYGVGGGMVATGLLLYYLGWPPGRTGSNTVAWLPALSPGQASLTFQAGF